jgi:hypothetical protein
MTVSAPIVIAPAIAMLATFVVVAMVAAIALVAAVAAIAVTDFAVRTGVVARG